MCGAFTAMLPLMRRSLRFFDRAPHWRWLPLSSWRIDGGTMYSKIVSHNLSGNSSKIPSFRLYTLFRHVVNSILVESSKSEDSRSS